MSDFAALLLAIGFIFGCLIISIGLSKVRITAWQRQYQQRFQRKDDKEIDTSEEMGHADWWKKEQDEDEL